MKGSSGRKLTLLPEDLHEIEALLADVVRRYGSLENPEILLDAAVIAHELPHRVRMFLHRFKLEEPETGVCVMSGFPIDDSRIGPTPAHWSSRAEGFSTSAEEILLVLCASLLGECFGWASQQGGALIHNLLPVQQHEEEQLGVGSKHDLFWHTEDAFHDFRSDYVGLLCLRNPTGVPTTVASLAGLQLPPECLEELFTPQFVIHADGSHIGRHDENGNGGTVSRIGELVRRSTVPDRVAALFGNPSSPYLRLDPLFTGPLQENEPGQRAFDLLVQGLSERLQEFVLQPGDVCFIDNYRVVHGRKGFKARYDGTDRWLKRVNVTRDLRRSSMARSPQSRIIM